MTPIITFALLSFFIGICSLLVIFHPNPVMSAIFLVADLFFLAGVYALQGAHFVAVIQIIIYAGAIVVLFMFVIMLLGGGVSRLQMKPLDLGLLVFTLIGLLVMALKFYLHSGNLPQVIERPEGISLDELSLALFRDFLWPFEIASILILAAVVASILIAKKPHHET